MADFAQYDPIPIHGEPGVGIVGTNRYQVGVQSESPDMAAWAARQPNLDRAKATEEANRVAKEGLYLDHLMLNQRTTASARQVEAAMTFQAMRNYERDLSTAKAAGLSEEQAALQALVRNPKVLGSGFGSGVRALQPRQTMESAGPPAVITDPETGQRLGVRIPTGPTGGTFRPDAPVKRPGSLTQVESARIRQLDREEIELKKALATPPGRFARQAAKDAYAAQTNSIATIRKERDKLLGTATAPAVQATPLTKDKALEFLKAAGGDKEKARKLAREAGFTF